MELKKYKIELVLPPHSGKDREPPVLTANIQATEEDAKILLRILNCGSFGSMQIGYVEHS